jgi:hypothetical protein
MAETATTEARAHADQAMASAQVQFVIASIAVVGLVLAVGATIGWGMKVGVGVLIGATLATLNLWSLKRIGAGFFSGSGRRRRLWGVAGASKFILLAALIGVLIALHLVHPIALLIGYGSLPIGITIGTFLGPRVAEESV